MINVLFVDDDKNLQDIYASLFPFKNIDIVAQAYDGVEAIEIYNDMETKPDLVLMDQRMPRMDGITATRSLLEIDSSIKIIFLSADDSLMTRALRAGAKSFLPKPISMNLLIDSISATMSKP